MAEEELQGTSIEKGKGEEEFLEVEDLIKETLEERMLNIYQNDFRREGLNFVNWFSSQSSSIKEEPVTAKKDEEIYIPY